jgi:hypothetical protein
VLPSPCGNIWPARRFDKGFELRSRHEHVVGRDAGLARVEQLARQNAGNRVRQRVLRRNDRRRLAAEFQRHRRQVRGRGRHHPAPDRGRSGEQQVIERQCAEVRRDRRVAVDDGDLVRGEARGHEPPETRAERRRELRQLDHDAIAGGERTRQRPDAEEDRVVPRHDDADHPEWLRHDFAARRHVPLGHRRAPRAHPAPPVPHRPFHFLQ